MGDGCVDGCRVGALLSVNGHEPPHAALAAIIQREAPVPRHSENSVVALLVERAHLYVLFVRGVVRWCGIVERAVRDALCPDGVKPIAGGGVNGWKG